MTVFIAPCYTERLNWPLGLTCALAAQLLSKNLYYTPSQILSWDLDSRLGGKLVEGGDGYLVAKLAKCSGQRLGTFLLFSRTDFSAPFDKSHSFRQDLPN